MKKTVTVAKRHFLEGEPGDCDSCPAALAMIEQGFPNASVYHDYINWDRGGRQMTVPTPQVVKDFLNRFDDPAELEPKIQGWNRDMFEEFSFEIEEGD